MTSATRSSRCCGTRCTKQRADRHRRRVDEDRLQQVWFTGMHADVGGGYPDESLSYVSLLWMMEEAEKAGLRTLKVIKDRFVALASSFGPIHDSRAGMAAYYRYQPRKIAAWLDPVDRRTLGLRDPAITDDRGRSRGLLRSVKVHESVINRIATGTDRYAPITLPKTFSIVPPQVEGENVPQADNQAPAPPTDQAHAESHGDRHLRARLMDEAAAGARASATEAIWNFVWWRRITYFATLTPTLLLLACRSCRPAAQPPVLADGRTWIGGVIRLLTLVLPASPASGSRSTPTIRSTFCLGTGLILLIPRLRERDRAPPSRQRKAGMADRAGGAWPRSPSVARADVQEQPPVSALRSRVQMVLPARLDCGAGDGCGVRLDCLPRHIHRRRCRFWKMAPCCASHRRPRCRRSAASLAIFLLPTFAARALAWCSMGIATS